MAYVPGGFRAWRNSMTAQLTAAIKFFKPMYDGDHSAFQSYKTGEVTPDAKDMDGFINSVLDGMEQYLGGRDHTEVSGLKTSLRSVRRNYASGGVLAEQIRAWCLAQAIEAAGGSPMDKLQAAIDLHTDLAGPIKFAAEETDSGRVQLTAYYAADVLGASGNFLEDEPWTEFGGDKILESAGFSRCNGGMDAYQDKYGDSMVCQWAIVIK
jgi:hypothetical protein